MKRILDRRMRFLFIALLLVVLIILAYLPAINGGFVWDDDFWVYNNPHVTGEKSIWKVWYTATVPGQNYPLTYTFFWAQSRFWGLNPFGFHLSNILLHILNVFLLWVILKKIPVRGAGLIAAVFGLHPLMVESVAWITEAKNTLSAFFLFNSFIFFLDYERKGAKLRYYIALLLYLLALLGKTFVAPFPLAMLVIRWYRGKELNNQYLKNVAPFFALSLLAGGFTWWYEHGHVGVGGERWMFSATERILVAGRAFWFYLGKLLVPLNLTFIYPRWELSSDSLAQWMFPLLVLVGFILCWGLRRRVGRGPFSAFACYIIFLLPALGFISFYAQVYSFVADHYAYLASIGPIAFFISGGVFVIKSRKLRQILGIIMLSALFVLTTRQAGIYRSLETLYRDILSKNPKADMAHNNLGVMFFNRSRIKEAITCYREAIRHNPRNAYSYNNLGLALTELGRPDVAVVAFTEAIRIRPQTAGFYIGMGSALEAGGNVQEANSYYRKALDLKPDLVEGRIKLGIALVKIGDIKEAIHHYREALRFEPHNPAVHNGLGMALSAEGKRREAIEHYRKALEFDPAFQAARGNLANALAADRKLEEAIRLYHQLLADSPGNAQVHYNLGVVRMINGEKEEAQRHFIKALELRPDYAEAHLNLGNLLAETGGEEEVLQHYRQALKIKPAYVNAHYRMGVIMAKRGEAAEARRYLKEAVRLRPDFVEAENALAELSDSRKE